MELHHSSEKEAPKKVTKLFFNIPLVITACRAVRMDAASVFARLTGRCMVGALSFSLLLKIGPLPTPHLWVHRGLAQARTSRVSVADAQSNPPRVILE